MTATSFRYATIAKTDSQEVGSVMATRYSAERRFQAVMWDASRKIWMFAPAIAGGYIGDIEYMDRTTEVSRETAERVALDTLESDLPTEQGLVEICEEGERMGWAFGPPYEDED